MTFLYLSTVLVLPIYPSSYHTYDESVNWLDVFAQFLVVDFMTFLNHVIEHNFPRFYKISHKPHHVFINPKLYNAFNGSILDTLSLIVIPLLVTGLVCHVNLW